MPADVPDPARGRPLGVLIRAIRTTVTLATGCLFLVLLAVLLAQVFVRYVLHVSMFWSEEFVRFALVWLVMLSAALAIDQRLHIRVDVLDRYLSERWNERVRLLVDVGVAVFLVLLLVYGMEFVERGGRALSPALGLARRWVYLAIPVGSALMLLFLALHHLDRLVSGRPGGGRSPAGPER